MYSTPNTLLNNWIEVDTAAIAHNISHLMGRGSNQRKKAILMIKANAYGHGLIEISQIAERAGISMLGITSVSDAIKLRSAGITLPLLFSGSISVDTAPLFHELDITASVDSILALEIIGKLNKRCEFHLKIDCGLHRYGFSPNDTTKLISNLKRLGLKPDGIYTHYSAANDNDERTSAEYHLFKNTVEKFIADGFIFAYIHASNSAGALWLDETLTDTVRLGLSAYGLQPNALRHVEIRPALSWKTRIDAIREVQKGESVGYGNSWKASRKSRIGIITVGYSDGFRSRPTHQNSVLCKGVSVPIISSIMMNHSAIDITDYSEICHGDSVTIIGKSGDMTLTLEDIAQQVGTINEEIVTQINPLISRIYT